MEHTDSVSFDRAADYYDKTRSLSAETMAALIPLLVDELAPGPCLEIGAGTGRIALPLLEAGVDVVGLDLSARMLSKLIANAGPRRLAVVVGDAGRLPFGDGTFASALAVHVLHLVPSWKEALRELVRAVTPGGRVLVDVGHHFQGPYVGIERFFAEQAGLPGRHRGANEPEEVDDVMTKLGATVRRLPEIAESRPTTFAQTIQELEDGLFSFTWPASDADRSRAATATRAWVTERHGALDQSYDFGLVTALRAYDLP